MSKRKTLRRLSSAALLSLAMYSQTMTPGWTKEVHAFETRNQTKIERRIETRKKVNEFSLGKGSVKSVSSGSLVVTDTKDNKDYNVVLDDKTKIFSKSMVKVGPTDIKVGHEVSLIGKVENEDSAWIRAFSLRDLSLKISNGNFKGVVESVNPSSFILKTRSGNIKVPLVNVRVEDRRGSVMDSSMISIGDVVKVKGVYNGNEGILSMVSAVRDHSVMLGQKI